MRLWSAASAASDRTNARRTGASTKQKGTPHVESARADSLCRAPQWCAVQACSKYPAMSRSCSSRTFRIFVSSSSLSAPVPASCSSDGRTEKLLLRRGEACGPGRGSCALRRLGMFWAPVAPQRLAAIRARNETVRRKVQDRGCAVGSVCIGLSVAHTVGRRCAGASECDV